MPNSVIWPRSHVAVHKHFCEDPESIAKGGHGGGAAEAACAVTSPIELTMAPGDICFVRAACAGIFARLSCCSL